MIHVTLGTFELFIKINIFTYKELIKHDVIILQHLTAETVHYKRTVNFRIIIHCCFI